VVKAASVVFGEANSKKLAKILRVDSNIKIRINRRAKDIESQVLEMIHASSILQSNMMKQLISARFGGTQGARAPPKRAPHHIHVFSHVCDMRVPLSRI